MSNFQPRKKREIIISRPGNSIAREIMREEQAENERKLREQTDGQTADTILHLRRQKKNLPVECRIVAQEDIPFIFSSWLKSFKGSTFTKNIAPPIYFNEQHKLIERLFNTAKVIVAANPEDISQIYGYIMYDVYDGIFTFHYMYVKEIFRGLGVANQLARKAGFDKKDGGMFTHETFFAFKNSSKFNIVYHPYLLTNYKLIPENSSDINLKKPV